MTPALQTYTVLKDHNLQYKDAEISGWTFALQIYSVLKIHSAYVQYRDKHFSGSAYVLHTGSVLTAYNDLNTKIFLRMLCAC